MYKGEIQLVGYGGKGFAFVIFRRKVKYLTGLDIVGDDGDEDEDEEENNERPLKRNVPLNSSLSKLEHQEICSPAISLRVWDVIHKSQMYTFDDLVDAVRVKQLHGWAVALFFEKVVGMPSYPSLTLQQVFECTTACIPTRIPLDTTSDPDTVPEVEGNAKASQTESSAIQLDGSRRCDFVCMVAAVITHKPFLPSLSTATSSSFSAAPPGTSDSEKYVIHLYIDSITIIVHHTPDY
jgi:hypothetical protein